MKIILKENIKGVGRKFEVKEVADGYANNFLLPRKLAEYASPEAVKRAETEKAATTVEIEVREKLAEKQMEMLKGVKVALKKKGNEKGHLFEQVHLQEISAALKEQAGIEIEPGFLSVEKPIKEAGEHKISIEIGKNRGELVVVVDSE